MISAYILINTEDGSENVFKSVKRLGEAFLVYGIYDIILKVQATSIDELKEIHLQLASVPNVRGTLTLIVNDSLDFAKRTLRCLACGSEMPLDAKYCGICGAKLLNV